jgi:hypothetical protein
VGDEVDDEVGDEVDDEVDDEVGDEEEEEEEEEDADEGTTGRTVGSTATDGDLRLEDDRHEATGIVEGDRVAGAGNGPRSCDSLAIARSNPMVARPTDVNAIPSSP